jgi:hypothetical protein
VEKIGSRFELVERIVIRRYESPRWRVTPSATTRPTGLPQDAVGEFSRIGRRAPGHDGNSFWFVAGRSRSGRPKAGPVGPTRMDEMGIFSVAPGLLRSARNDVESSVQTSPRHCEELFATKQSSPCSAAPGLLRGACHRARIRATRWLAMTARGRWKP